MPTNTPIFDLYSVNNLKLKLSAKTGWKINNKPDCQKLSQLVFESGCGYLSEATLYRLFFQPTKYKPYKSTLDILCKYLGFKDSFHFLDSEQTDRSWLENRGIPTEHYSGYNLLFYCIEHDAKNILKDFFESMQEMPQHYKESISIALFDSLIQSNNPERFFKNFANDQFVRKYFFESAHDPKFRIKNYDFAYQMYLRDIDKNRDLLNFQDFIFGNSIMLRHNFLNETGLNPTQIGKTLYQEIQSLHSFEKDLAIFPLIRYKAYKLWYLQLIGKTRLMLEDYANSLLEWCEQLKNKLSFDEKKIIFHTLAETFINSTISESFHGRLKEIFQQEFNTIPSSVASKHLKYSLPYFEMNGLLFHRP